MKPKHLAMLVIQKLKSANGDSDSGDSDIPDRSPRFSMEGEERDKTGGISDEPSGTYAAAEELLKGIKSNDARAVEDALKAFVDLYDSDGEDSSEGD